MIKDLLVSFKDNIKSKSSNPFLGTYAAIWCIRNWRLVYSFFFFDSKTTLTERIDILASYYTYKSFVSDLFINILWALGALILSYMLINLSRLIVNLFEKRLTPYVYKITDSDSIVLKETYDRLKSDKQELEIKLEKERDSKGKMQKEISSLEEQIQEMFLANAERQGEEPLNKERDIANSDSNKPEDILFNKLKKKNLLDDFLNTYLKVSKEDGWLRDEGENMNYYIRLGLINGGKTEDEWSQYLQTDIGSKVVGKIRLAIE